MTSPCFPTRLKNMISISDKSSSCMSKQKNLNSIAPPSPSWGYILAAGNIRMDTEKVRAVVDWLQPNSKV